MEQPPAGGGVYPKIILEDQAYPSDHTCLVHPRRLLAGIVHHGVEGLQLFPSNLTPWLPLKNYHWFQPLTCRRNHEGSSRPLCIACRFMNMDRLCPPLGKGFRTTVQKPNWHLVHIPNVPLVVVGTDEEETSCREEV